jgi:type VI secretion system protein ImpK
MSDKDQPPGSGRGERTIIRPNPGARRPVPPGAPPSSAGGAPPQVSYPAPPAPGVAGAPASTDEWISTPAAPRPVEEKRRAPDLRLDELAAPNENPIMRAAGPLLLLLGRLRVALMRASFASLMEQVAEAIKFFEKDIRSAGIPEQQANTAKYILCATADDIVQNIPTEDRHVWTQYSMLSRFFGERIGGVRFFEELEKALKDPLVNYPLLELQHTCLALGFQGVHRTSPNGQSSLQQIQRNLYETLRRVRPKVVHDLSPRWQGQQLASHATRLRVPLWIVASVVGALLLALYITLLWLLSGGSDAVAASAATLHPSDKIEIARRVIAPPPPPPPPPAPTAQLPRIKRELADECITVAQSGSVIVIRLCDLALFESGKADVRDGFKPAAARIAKLLEGEKGFIKVVGHTDNRPIKSVRFPSNWHLSLERAKAVAELLKKGLSRPDRVQTDGKGSDTPVATNETPEGRSKNRRVEILIPRID